MEANQGTVDIRIMESEVSEEQLNPEEGIEIGIAVMDLPPNLPANSPIEITFVINEEGTLDIKALEVTDQRTVEATIETSSVISGEELEVAKARSSSISVS